MATNQINDFTITEWVNLEAYMRDTGMLDFRLEDMQNFTLNATQDKTAQTGKNGRVIGYKKQNKAITGEGTYGMVSAGLLKVQTGGTVENGEYLIKKSEFKAVKGATIVTDAVAEGVAGAEISYLKVLAPNGSVSITYEQAATADKTHFAYDPATKNITLPIDGDKAVISDGSNVIYAYERKVSGTKVTNPSDTFSEVREVWIHAFGTDACDNEYFIAIYIPRADFSGEFSIELGGDQTVQNFSFDGMTDLCNPSMGNNLFEVIVYTGDTADTAVGG